MRILKLIGLVLLVVLVGAAAMLLPAHLQIRDIEPDLPSASELRSLSSHPDRPIRVSYLRTAEQPRAGDILGHTVFVAEWADGRRFMVDASMDETAASEFASLMRSLGEAGDEIYHGSVVDLIGEDIARIDGVGLTHLHIDHTQGLVPFCAARGAGAKIFQTPWQAEEVNLHTREGAEIVGASCLTREVGERSGLYALPGFGGVGMIALGGHTPGSTLFAIAGPDQTWLFAGDTTNVKRHIPDNQPKALAYSYLMVPENTARTEQLRRWLAELDAASGIRVIVSHDIEDTVRSGMPAYSTNEVDHAEK
ncbi:MAG: MBL fold metallo-hydrolase [Myxococcota bacterium]